MTRHLELLCHVLSAGDCLAFGSHMQFMKTCWPQSLRGQRIRIHSSQSHSCPYRYFRSTGCAYFSLVSSYIKPWGEPDRSSSNWKLGGGGEHDNPEIRQSFVGNILILSFFAFVRGVPSACDATNLRRYLSGSP